MFAVTFSEPASRGSQARCAPEETWGGLQVGSSNPEEGFNMRNTLVTGTIVALALTGFATRASAQNPFLIDGVITPTNNSGVAPQALFTPDPTGTKEFGPLNGANTKVGVINFATPPPTILGDTTMPSKVDLTGVFTQAALGGTDFWFYYAWNRATTSGSGFMAVEFQRAAKPTVCALNYDPINTTALAGCNPWANRDGDGTPQNSDFMILWDQQGNSFGLQNIFARFYNKAAAAFGPAQNLTLAGSAVAVYGGNGSDPSKGEMALNFSAITGAGQNECLTFANIIPNTVTGNSDTADYKDTVLSNFPVASNCGTVTIKKVTVPASTGISFEYTLADGVPMFGVATPDSDCDAGSNLNTCIGTVEHNVTDTITDLLQGNNYTLVESDKPSNYVLDSIVCTPDGGSAVNITAGGTFSVAATKTTACVITNSLAKGDLKIVKTVVGGFGLNDLPGAFSYTLDGNGFYFTDTGLAGGTSCVSGAVCKTVNDTVGSTHTVLEPNPLVGYTASLSSDQIGHANDCTNLTISSTPVTCTVTNTANQASPSAVTRQRVLLFDRANLAGVRRTAGDAGTMSVTFSLYADLAKCTAQTPALTSQSVAVVFPNATDTSVNGIPTTGGYEFKLDTAGDTGSIAHYWRAVFHQTGVNPPNADFTTPCTEITTVRIQQ